MWMDGGVDIKRNFNVAYIILSQVGFFFSFGRDEFRLTVDGKLNLYKFLLNAGEIIVSHD